MFDAYEAKAKGPSGSAFRLIVAAIVCACGAAVAAYVLWPSPYSHLVRRLHAGMTEQQVMDALAGEPTMNYMPDGDATGNPNHPFKLGYPVKGKPFEMVIYFDRSKVIQSWCEHVEGGQVTSGPLSGATLYPERCHPIK